MNKKILAIGIVSLFLIVGFAGATTISTDTTKQSKPMNNDGNEQIPFAHIELNGRLRITNGYGWPYPGMRIMALLKIPLLLASKLWATVDDGTLSIKPTNGAEITLDQYDTIDLKVAFVLFGEYDPPGSNTLSLFKGMALGVTYTQQP